MVLRGWGCPDRQLSAYRGPGGWIGSSERCCGALADVPTVWIRCCGALADDRRFVRCCGALVDGLAGVLGVGG